MDVSQERKQTKPGKEKKKSKSCVNNLRGRLRKKEKNQFYA